MVSKETVKKVELGTLRIRMPDDTVKVIKGNRAERRRIIREHKLEKVNVKRS